MDYHAEGWAFPKDGDYEEPGPKEKKIIRHRIYERDGGRCVVCGVPLREEPGSWGSAHLHHKRGGRHRKDWTDANLEIRCIYDHNDAHNPKAVPPKPR